MNRVSPLSATVTPKPFDAAPASAASLLMRKCACGQNASGSCEECTEKKEAGDKEGLQRKAAGRGGAHAAPSIVQEVVASPGQALDDATRTLMEQRFGHDFASVRVHADARAAQSARSVDAHAYTVGQHVVFGAGRFAPQTQAGRHLLAHELAHTLQQRGATGRRQNRLSIHPANTPEERAADRAADAVTAGGTVPAVTHAAPHGGLQRAPDPDACDKDHGDAITKAATTAEQWLGSVSTWMDAHLALIKNRTPKDGGFRKVGAALFSQLSLLDTHFKFADIVRKEPWRGRFPDSANWEGNFKDFETLGRASYFIRKNFSRVHVADLGVHCQKPCPEGAEGAELVGSAHAGSREYTIYTNCFDKQVDLAKAGAVLHEAFHACFDDFTGDSYSHSKDYPGVNAVSNADSYATFASVVATGNSYRIQVVEVTITGSTEPEAP